LPPLKRVVSWFATTQMSDMKVIYFLCTVNSMTNTSFSYRGLVFRIERSDTLNFWTIKQGNRIVLRMFTLPHKIEADIVKAIDSIKEGIERGFGLNIDYSKVV